MYRRQAGWGLVTEERKLFWAPAPNRPRTDELKLESSEAMGMAWSPLLSIDSCRSKPTSMGWAGLRDFGLSNLLQRARTSLSAKLNLFMVGSSVKWDAGRFPVATWQPPVRFWHTWPLDMCITESEAPGAWGRLCGWFTFAFHLGWKSLVSFWNAWLRLLS